MDRADGWRPDPDSVRHWNDIGYSCDLRIGEMNDCYVDVRVYRISGWGTLPNGPIYSGSDGSTARLYRITGAGSNGPNDLTYDLAEAEVFLSGNVKWDGCSNLHFDAQEHGMIHFCGVNEAVRLGALMERVYDFARDVIPRPNW